MGRVIRILALLVLVCLALFAVLAVAARFHDGPLAIFPGGPLTSGAMTSAQGVDWSFATDIPEVEFQLLTPRAPARSGYWSTRDVSSCPAVSSTCPSGSNGLARH